ncbi:MAG TPA: 30S ribosomal protein S6 [Patescibacteria group bacterium]|nr:30S ribosomal protein S6 [Patescibacteria group bacterium]
MRLYELVLVVRPSVKEADRKKLVETVKDWLGKEVKFTKEDDWGQKPLAYPIKKEIAGYYTQMQFESEAAIEKGFETRLIRTNDIIRHLLLRTK